MLRDQFAQFGAKDTVVSIIPGRNVELAPDLPWNLADDPDRGGLYHLVGAEIGLDEDLESIATFLLSGELRDAELKVGKATQ